MKPTPTQIANCCQCGRIIDTREAKDGGDNFGAQLSDGRWTCSIECDNEVTGLDDCEAIDRIERHVSAALSLQPAEAVVGEPVGMGVFRNGEMIGFVGIGDEFKLPEDTDERRPIYAAPSAPEGWQPIETAPKDGTTLWVLDELYGKPWHYECNWNGIEWYHGFGVAWPDARPTHWRPLPAPPAIGGASHE